MPWAKRIPVKGVCNRLQILTLRKLAFYRTEGITGKMTDVKTLHDLQPYLFFEHLNIREVQLSGVETTKRGDPCQLEGCEPDKNCAVNRKVNSHGRNILASIFIFYFQSLEVKMPQMSKQVMQLKMANPLADIKFKSGDGRFRFHNEQLLQLKNFPEVTGMMLYTNSISLTLLIQLI